MLAALLLALQRCRWPTASGSDLFALSLNRWLTFAAVCAAHILLVGSFANSARFSNQHSAKPSSFDLRIKDKSISVFVIQANAQPALPLQSAALPPARATTQRNPRPELLTQTTPPKQAEQTEQAEPPFRPALAVLNKEKFLDFDALDQAAVAFSQFESALVNTLPASFEVIVLELFIDESGRTVQLACIEGDCTDELRYKLPDLMDVPFTPAMKNGESVASRKIIQLLPAPTYGL